MTDPKLSFKILADSCIIQHFLLKLKTLSPRRHNLQILEIVRNFQYLLLQTFGLPLILFFYKFYFFVFLTSHFWIRIKRY